MDQPLGSARILVGDAHHMLAELRNESVHCIVTSPPYFGLRDYGTETWHGGDPECSHQNCTDHQKQGKTSQRTGRSNTDSQRNENFRSQCLRCGARRIDQQIGLNNTVDDYIDQLVSVFRELWRVLRKDGIAWLNLGDSYAGNGVAGFRPGSGRANGRVDKRGQRNRNGVGRIDGLKPKDLIGVPWRVAFALQADGWYLRSDIIWEKINCMPESVRDRPTRSHEYIFMLTKSERYYYDADAIAEPNVSVDPRGNQRIAYNIKTAGQQHAPSGNAGYLGQQSKGRNRRSVWRVSTKPFKGAHFATFPPALIEPCILASTSERGVCGACGAPWCRGRERTGHENRREPAHAPNNAPTKTDSTGWAPVTRATEEWMAGCSCSSSVQPSTVLDPFCGAGTALLVAARHGRQGIGVELNPDYARMAEHRLLQAGIAATVDGLEPRLRFIFGF